MHSTKGTDTQFTILRVALQLLRLSRRRRHLSAPQMYRCSRAPFALFTAILVAIGGSFGQNNSFLKSTKHTLTSTNEVFAFRPSR